LVLSLLNNYFLYGFYSSVEIIMNNKHNFHNQTQTLSEPNSSKQSVSTDINSLNDPFSQHVTPYLTPAQIAVARPTSRLFSQLNSTPSRQLFDQLCNYIEDVHCLLLADIVENYFTPSLAAQLIKLCKIYNELYAEISHTINATLIERLDQIQIRTPITPITNPDPMADDGLIKAKILDNQIMVKGMPLMGFPPLITLLKQAANEVMTDNNTSIPRSPWEKIRGGQMRKQLNLLFINIADHYSQDCFPQKNSSASCLIQ
jgi:hypothetical protein